ncbi:hypothetical protein FACS1894151_01460 [Spirochaetia bacterium]|nr:hypothetical protein FACS1894151_01460 [Spirochaetia bacterium]
MVIFAQRCRYLFVFFLVLSALSLPLNALGKAENAQAESLYREWVLCITAFDVSALSASRRLAGETLATRLLESLNTIKTHIRIAPEYDYYTGAAWSKARSEAAAKLAAKRIERDNLLFQGLSEAQYRTKLQEAETAIAELEQAFLLADTECPVVDSEPVFALSEENKKGNFPPLPDIGHEYRFCKDQKADAFLAGVITEFHGRLVIDISLYAYYTQRFVFRDSIVFSQEDLDIAVEELAGVLVSAVSGAAPAALSIAAEPDTSRILIDGMFAGQDETGAAEYPPGQVAVTVFAENHVPQTVDLSLVSGEFTSLFVQLEPFENDTFNLVVPQQPGSSVYRGSRYVGETPLLMELPQNRHEYLTVETPEGMAASLVFVNNGAGSASAAEPEEITFIPHPVGAEKMVEKRRNDFYFAFGIFWVTLPLAVLLNGFASTYTNAYNTGRIPEMYDPAITWYYTSWAANGAAALALGFSLFQMYRYISASSKDASPLEQ